MSVETVTLVYGVRLRAFCSHCEQEIDLPPIDRPMQGDFRERVFENIRMAAMFHRSVPCKSGE